MSSRQERAVLGFLANVLIFSVALAIYHYDAYYIKFLRAETKQVLTTLYIAYLILGLPLSLMFPSNRESKGLVILGMLSRTFHDMWGFFRHYPSPDAHLSITKEEKTATLFMLVKFFFLPIMINFMFQNGNGLMNDYNKLATLKGTQAILMDGWYPLLISLIFFIDTAYFTFGYAIEHPLLKNTVRSVEPTLFGWMIALLCYPPFNDVPGYYVGWAANDYAMFDSVAATGALRVAVVILLGIYVWASIALGTRCSNLTNRGIVSRGPYAYVRHPAYIAKNMAWWLTSIPFMIETHRIGFALISMGAWSLIYFLRAITEERHLGMDPDYQEYCRKVKWRFIPYVF